MQAIARLLPPFHPGSTALGLMVVRLVAGAAMMLHGWPKIQEPMTWMEKMAPGQVAPVLQAAAAVAEFGGGICWMLGLLTPIASLLIWMLPQRSVLPLVSVLSLLVSPP